MLYVPGEVVEQVTSSLLTSYDALYTKRRLPRLRELIELAVAGLRSSEYLAMIDEVLVGALSDPRRGDPGAACATAQLILGAGDPTPALAQALVTAAGRWDQPEFSEVLLRLVSPGTASPLRLAGNWDTRLRMRALLRREPRLVEKIRRSTEWLSIMLCLYGGMPDLRAAEATEKFQQMTAYLKLPYYVREGFKPVTEKLLGMDDFAYATAQYSETADYDVSQRLAQPPIFTPDAIIRNSPYTDRIIEALEHDGITDLIDFFRSRLGSGDTERGEALVALWSLGVAPSGGLTDGTPAAAMANRRIAAVAAGLRDATARALAQSARDALLAASGTVMAEDWNQLYDAVVATAMRAGAPQISMLIAIANLPPGIQTHVLTEEITHWISGSGEDSLREAARVADQLNSSRQPPETILGALNTRGLTTHEDFRHCTRWWPADPLAFPCQDGNDVPMAVLDQVTRMPRQVFFGAIWMLRDIVMPVVERNQSLMPEVLTIAWSCLGRGDADATEFIGNLNAAILDADNPAVHLRRLASQVSSPRHRARGLLRIAELFAHDRAQVLTEAARAARAARKVSDPVLAFQLWERLALLTSSGERAKHVAVGRRLAAEITDPAVANRALLRLARFEPSAVAIDEREDTGDAILLHLASGDATEAWTSIALFARATDLSRAAGRAVQRDAWRQLASAPSHAALAAVLASQDGPFISCTETTALSITAAFDHVGQPAFRDELYSLLLRLAHLECGAEPAVRGWLGHPDARLREVAALLLAEYGGWRAELAEPVTQALLAEDDLLRTRANACIWTGGSFGATGTPRASGGRG